MATQTKKLDWIDALKAFAILGILLNHAVESFQSYPWFSNPSNDWPSFAERMSNIFPKDGSFFIQLIQFLGWLGDMGPGVFIFLSGLTLTLSALQKPQKTLDFYKTRALRIYPLYISIHLLILILAFTLFNWGSKYLLLMSPLSILGLRFTNSLFGFLNPSWWFIWLILQLYLVFPFLLALLKKSGAAYFLGATLIITILSRSAGILGYTFSGDLYAWMTGLFGGTRLFEFSFGMYIGFLLQNKNIRLTEIMDNKTRLLLISMIIYLTGFGASWTYVGSIFSNMLITIGLSGIFYSIYELIIQKNKSIKTSMLWIGKNSFSAFLLHQPFMIYFGSELSGNEKVFSLVLIILASFFVGNLIEKQVNRLIVYIQSKFNFILGLFKQKLGLILFIGTVSGTSLLSLLIIQEKIGISKYVLLIYFMQVAYLLFYRVIIKPELPYKAFRFLDTSIALSIIILLLSSIWLPLFGFFIIFSFLLLIILKPLNHWNSVISTLAVLVISISIGEFLLQKYKPGEEKSWGELPALQLDSETVYSLIPNKLTHLKYDNYDYIVKTNSIGFASPEIDLTKKNENEVRIMIVGDAFSMPEGMEYEFSYPSLLEKKLRNEFSEKSIHVINAGVTGYGPIEEQAQLKKYIDLIRPDIIINELFINEFSEINISKNSRLLDIGLIKEKFYKSRFFSTAVFPTEISSYFNIMSESTSVAKHQYNKALLALYEKKSYIYNDSVITKLNSFLVQMKKLSIEKKAKYMILGVPGQIEISEPKHITFYPYSENLMDTSRYNFDLPLFLIKNLCLKNNILYLDNKEYLKTHPIQPLYFEGSWHWNKNGHAAIAEYIAAYLKSNGLIVSIEQETNSE